MVSFVLKLYEYMKGHRVSCFLFFFLLSAFFAFQILRLNYKEDISDFLPLDGKYRDALRVYQNFSGINDIFVIFRSADSTKTNPDEIVEAINTYLSKLDNIDTLSTKLNVTSQVDINQLTEITGFVYANIPYFLQEEDYARIDSLLSEPGYMDDQLRQDKQMLMLPGGGLLSRNISRDPLNLFTPVVSVLQHGFGNLSYEMYNGYIFSPNMQKAIVMVKSPYGSSETEKNSRLLSMLQACADSTVHDVSGVEINLTGGPAIAVANATQIKSDSVVSVTISVSVIVMLLLFVFRDVKNLILIVISIGWGWLFGLGGLALFNNNVSIIVLGISSVIIGIAVNYPLHLIAHLYHSNDVRSALREIVSPLVVGNITTVGAFLCLVPLNSVALRDLGLFSSFLLIGTIAFVLLFLPHIARPHKNVNIPFLEKVGALSLENRPVLVVAVVILTAVLGYFSLSASFDANMSHINYVPERQKTDMDYFQKNMTQTSTNANLYIVASDSSLDKSLGKSLRAQARIEELVSSGDVIGHSPCSRFITSKEEQGRRLCMWKQFVARYSTLMESKLREAVAEEGFSSDAFDEFHNILSSRYTPQDYEHFDILANTVFASNISVDSVRKQFDIVDVLIVPPAKMDKVKESMGLSSDGCYVFDVNGMNGSVTSALSDNFNYIGWACSLIVFFFLWFSLGSIELAMLSFFPMAISWIWILGIMGLLGIKFNIVNVILATFIFGQGDDYTIFMTEGACYEYAYRRKMLASYKSSIVISALVMFVGMGSLILAKHPALRSLAEVTIVGMFSVVLMAYLFPPLIFKWLVMKGGKYRTRPLSLALLLPGRGRKGCESTEYLSSLVKDRYRYKGVETYRTVKRHLRKFDNYAKWIDGREANRNILVVDSGVGEFALLYALSHKNQKVTVIAKDELVAALIKYGAEGIADNLEVKTLSNSAIPPPSDKLKTFVVMADERTRNDFIQYNPIIIQK